MRYSCARKETIRFLTWDFVSNEVPSWSTGSSTRNGTLVDESRSRIDRCLCVRNVSDADAEAELRRQLKVEKNKQSGAPAEERTEGKASDDVSESKKEK